MITATARVANPSDVQIAVTVTMPINDWKMIATDLATSKNFPALALRMAVAAAIGRVVATAEEEIKEIE